MDNPTQLQDHQASCGEPDGFFVHFVSCSRCGRKFRKDGYEVDRIVGDLVPEKYHIIHRDGSKEEAW